MKSSCNSGLRWTIGIFILLCTTSTIYGAFDTLQAAFHSPAQAEIWLPLCPLGSLSNRIVLDADEEVSVELPSTTTLKIVPEQPSSDISLFSVHYLQDSGLISETRITAPCVENPDGSRDYVSGLGAGERIVIAAGSKHQKLTLYRSSTISSNSHWIRIAESSDTLFASMSEEEIQTNAIPFIQSIDPVASEFLDQLNHLILPDIEMDRLCSFRQHLWNEFIMMRRLLNRESTYQTSPEINAETIQINDQEGWIINPGTSWNVEGPSLHILNMRVFFSSKPDDLRNLSLNIGIDDHLLLETVTVRRDRASSIYQQTDRPARSSNLNSSTDIETDQSASYPRMIVLYVPSGNHVIHFNPSEPVWCKLDRILPEAGRAPHLDSMMYTSDDNHSFEESLKLMMFPEKLFESSLKEISSPNHPFREKTQMSAGLNATLFQNAKNIGTWRPLEISGERSFRQFPKAILRQTPEIPVIENSSQSGYQVIESDHVYRFTAESPNTEQSLFELQFYAFESVPLDDLHVLVDGKQRMIRAEEYTRESFAFSVFCTRGEHELVVSYPSGSVVTNIVDSKEAKNPVIIRKCVQLRPGQECEVDLPEDYAFPFIQLFWKFDSDLESSSDSRLLVSTSNEKRLSIELPDLQKYKTGGVQIPIEADTRFLRIQSEVIHPVSIATSMLTDDFRAGSSTLRWDYKSNNEIADELLEVSPVDRPPSYQTIERLMAQGYYREALQAFSEITPELESYHYQAMRVFVMAAGGYPQKAIELASEMERHWKIRDPRFERVCAEAALDAGKTALADLYLGRIERVNSLDSHYWKLRVRCFAQAGLFNEALEILNTKHPDPVFPDLEEETLRQRLIDATQACSLPEHWAWISPNPKFQDIPEDQVTSTGTWITLTDSIIDTDTDDSGKRYLSLNPGEKVTYTLQFPGMLRIAFRPHYFSHPDELDNPIKCKITLDSKEMVFNVPAIYPDRSTLRYHSLTEPVPGRQEFYDLPLSTGNHEVEIEILNGAGAIRNLLQVPGPDDWPASGLMASWIDRFDKTMAVFSSDSVPKHEGLAELVSVWASLSDSSIHPDSIPFLKNWIHMLSDHVQWRWLSGLKSTLGSERINEFLDTDAVYSPQGLQIKLRNHRQVELQIQGNHEPQVLLNFVARFAHDSKDRILITQNQSVIGEITAETPTCKIDWDPNSESTLSLLLQSTRRGQTVPVMVSRQGLTDNPIDVVKPTIMRRYTQFNHRNPASIQVMGPTLLDISILSSEPDDINKIVSILATSMDGSGDTTAKSVSIERTESDNFQHVAMFPGKAHIVIPLKEATLYEVTILSEDDTFMGRAAISGAMQLTETRLEGTDIQHRTVTFPIISSETREDVHIPIVEKVNNRTGVVTLAPGYGTWFVTLNGYEAEKHSTDDDDLDEFGTDGGGLRVGFRKRFGSIGCFTENTIESVHLSDQDDSWIAGYAHKSSLLPVLWDIRPYFNLSLYTQDLMSNREFSFRSSLDFRKTFQFGSRLRLVPAIGAFYRMQTLTEEEYRAFDSPPDWRIYSSFYERHPSGLTAMCLFRLTIVDGLVGFSNLHAINSSNPTSDIFSVWWWDAGLDWYSNGLTVDLAYQERYPTGDNVDPERSRIQGSVSWNFWMSDDALTAITFQDRYTFETNENAMQIGISVFYGRGRMMYDVDPNRIAFWDRIQDLAFERDRL